MNNTCRSILIAMLLAIAMPVIADDEASIREFIVRYDQAFEKGDIASIRGMLADDYVVFADGKRKNHAQAEAEFLEDRKDGSKLTLNSTVDRILVADKSAVAIGTIAWTDTDASGTTDSGSEYFTLVLNREADGWKVNNEHISEVETDDKD